MLDFLSDIAWPAVIAGTVYYFRNEFRAALARITKVGMSGVELGPTVPAQKATTTATTTTDLINSIRQFISPEQLDPMVTNIKGQLQARTLDKDEQFDILLHVFASVAIQLEHERVYRNIFGSQVEALNAINNLGGISEEQLKQYYDQAAARFPDFYKNYPFEKWKGYLLASGIVAQANDRYETTVYGRGFLKYAIDQHLPFPKPG